MRGRGAKLKKPIDYSATDYYSSSTDRMGCIGEDTITPAFCTCGVADTDEMVAVSSKAPSGGGAMRGVPTCFMTTKGRRGCRKKATMPVKERLLMSTPASST